LLSGCDGVHDNMRYWAAQFRRNGRATLVVDSHTPRGLDAYQTWRLVCAGQALGGATRAGDLAVALQALATAPGLTDDIVIFGASHGGWTAMELVGLAIAEAVPPGLRRWPAQPAGLLERVSALVLLYPYCGILNGAGPARWRGAPPALMVLAGNDSIVSTPDCLDRADALRATGATVRTEIIDDADHAFDQREKSVFSTLPFDAGQRDAAQRLVTAFVDEHARPPADAREGPPRRR
jgi:dienelactone hydrolase